MLVYVSGNRNYMLTSARESCGARVENLAVRWIAFGGTNQNEPTITTDGPLVYAAKGREQNPYEYPSARVSGRPARVS